MRLAVIGAALGLALALPAAADAATLVNAAFAGTLTSGSSAVRAPFNAAGSGITQGMAVSGSFVFDADLTPAAGTGFVLVPFATTPDASDPLNFDVGPLVFDIGNANSNPGLGGVAPQILFNNGVFDGFNYVSFFDYSGSTYRLRFQEKKFQVQQVDPATGFLISSTVLFQGNLGATLTETPFVPTTPGDGGVPEPASWALMITGFLGVGSLLRRRNALVQA
ncbi:MAG: PEPxxWA-CTERM sorting domain-containing protein [Proteobacteria bacterium]|nr:PEPxxWA-CTERM sorting domain-containing protein [Pseudomonadota bacterium]